MGESGEESLNRILAAALGNDRRKMDRFFASNAAFEEAVWRAHGLAPVMRECWEAGVVLAGWSAGSLCWHRGGPTDSFGDSLAVFTDGLGLLPYSNGVHDSLDDQPRRRVYREYVANGELPAGYATEDGVGLHYIGTELHEAVAMRDGAQAWWVEPSTDGGYHDEPITPRRL